MQNLVGWGQGLAIESLGVILEFLASAVMMRHGQSRSTSGTSRGSASGRYPHRDSRNELNGPSGMALPYPELESGLETVEA